MLTQIKITQNNQLLANLWVEEEHAFFKVYSNDTPKTICERFVKQFPEYAYEFAQEMKVLKSELYKESGIARDLGCARVAAQIPYPIYYAIKFLDDTIWKTDFWNKANKKNYRYIATIMPACFVGRM